MGKREYSLGHRRNKEMRKKVLAALLAAAVAGTTVMAGTAVFAAENTEGAKAAGGNITIA